MAVLQRTVVEELKLEPTAGEHLVQHLARGRTICKFRSLCSRADQSRVLNANNKDKNLFLFSKEINNSFVLASISELFRLWELLPYSRFC